MNLQLDHLVVAARSLAEGVAWCEATLGVTPGPGGKHPLMGTHNRLLALGGWPRAYLEIIAIDPDAPAPGRTRWFALDRFDAAPTLVHWVVRCPDIDAAHARLRAAGHDPGRVLDAERAGLRWRITVPDDGALRGGWPTLIEWAGAHPSESLPPAGVVLTGLALRHAGAGFPAPSGVGRAAGEGPSLVARLDTPRGPLTLESAA